MSKPKIEYKKVKRVQQKPSENAQVFKLTRGSTDANVVRVRDENKEFDFECNADVFKDVFTDFQQRLKIYMYFEVEVSEEGGYEVYNLHEPFHYISLNPNW